ncbi:MAG TPA: hypothetical protein VHC86_12215 [Opitutaceae bacterium]|nr:hypothetical protein [Opitutaceae bacterium]
MDQSPVSLAACECLTALGDTAQTQGALERGQGALELRPFGGAEGGDLVPLALIPGRPLDESSPPSWLPAVRTLMGRCPAGPWGGPRHPVFVTSSNFGVGGLFAFRRGGGREHVEFGSPEACVRLVRGELGWGPNVTTISHACVSSNLGLVLAGRHLAMGLADSALVFTFDFLSPFVAGGFYALKILNAGLPAPYRAQETGSIGLGDGAAFAVLERGEGEWRIEAQTLYNEMHHFTAFPADGSGFAACIEPLARLARGRRVWIKGHGTGTLDAGRLEAEAFARALPESPLVGWKGGLGHTLGSNGLVELAIAREAMRRGRIPGTVGTSAPTFAPNVAVGSLDGRAYDAVICASNAFGGAHAAVLLAHA